MAGEYAFPVLVELEESNTPRLKNKLVKYFQSKKSGGGDCEVDYEPGRQTALLRFRREEDQKNVLSKERHQISLGEGVLKMTVRLPAEGRHKQEESPDKGNKKSVHAGIDKHSTIQEPNLVDEGQAGPKVKDDDSDDDEQCSESAVLGNIPESLTSEFLEMLVENILRDLSSPTASEDYTLELIPDISSAVVTFQSGKDNTDFIERCPQIRMFTKKGLSVRPLETTKKVVVEGLSDCSEDMLCLYFEDKAGEVEDVQLNEAEQSAVVTFKKHQDVKKVLGKKHEIKKEEVKVYPFYKSLGVALYGKDKPSPKLPAAISEPIDTAVLRYLANNKATLETVGRDLEKHFCNITLEQSAVRLSASPSLLKQKDAKVIIKEWANTVKAAFSQAVSQYKSIKFSLDPEVWEESENKIKEKLQKEDVVVVSDKTSGILSVAGLENDVNTLKKPISEVLDRIKERVRRENLSKTQEINVSPSMFHILSQDGLQDKLLQVYPELKMLYDHEKKALKVTGFVDEIINATQVISNATLGLKRQNLEVDEFLLDMMKDEQQEEATDALLTAYGINAALEISPQRVQLVAVSDKDLMNAQDHLSQTLKSEYIEVEDLEVLKKPEWQQLVHQQKTANGGSGMRVQIITRQQQVVVSGHKDSVDTVSSELEDFITENAHVEEFVTVEANVIIEYLKSQTSWLKQLEGGVDVSFGKEEIILSGCRSAVKGCKSKVKDLLSSVCFDRFKVTKPGVKKFFKEKEQLYTSLIKSDTGCLVQLADKLNEEEDFTFIQEQQPIYKVQTSDGVEIVVSKADMCSYSVDAVVNPSTDDLEHTSGLALALSKAAGPQLQTECDQIIKVKGKLRPGDCVVTDAGGTLRCKKVIHAVGPRFDQAKPKRAEAQLKRTVKESFEQAEMCGCVSVALPAISRNLGFPLNLCLSTIARAVKDYCDEKYDDNTLKTIHLVDNEDSVALGLESAVKQEFGSHGVSVSSQNAIPKVSQKSPLHKLVPPDPSLCRGQTKEGLSIVLKKGNIEAAKTEVIVNTVAEDLILNKGAISNAIFSAAGAKLQQLVHSQKTSGSPGEIVVTDGCKLKSKQVFHVIAPSWDKGQGTAEKTLDGIFKDCLDLAEKARLSSISFPAVGTGNLGFPKNLVATLMLDKFLEFSSQRQSKHLKKIAVVLYPGDAQTIQIFTDEFKKKFPSATGLSMIAPAPEDSSQSTSNFSRVVSSSGKHETKLGNVTIQVITGDITKETTDVIINPSNDNFTLMSGVSKAILDAAGGAVFEECRYLGSQPNPGIIMTIPGNLKCKKVLHLAVRSDGGHIHSSVKEALQMCMKNSYTSVSFSALGTDQGKVQAKQVADSMLDAVIDVFSHNTSSSLTLIRIVIFQQPMLKDFHSSMQEREATDPKDKVGFWSNLSHKINKVTPILKSMFGLESPDNKQDIETVKVEPAVFHICGASQSKLDAAKKKINDLISDEQFSIEIIDNDILNFSSADCRRIVDIQMEMSVSIKNQITNGQVSMIIEGLSKDVLRANQEIANMLKKVRQEQELKRKLELAATVADWQYQQHGDQYQSFDQKTNYELEHALERAAPTLKITIHGSDYTVQMPKGPATDSKGTILQIRRIDKLKGDNVPEFWDAMPAGKTCHAVPILAASSEYTEVINLFKATCNRTVAKIERIQNPTLWKSLQIKKHEMEVRNNHQNNEKLLFHGTSEDTVPIINVSGFNRSYAGKNAAYFGNGSYFAVKADYSAQDIYSKPNANGEKFMYLCRVLTGDYTKGLKDMVAPPSKGGSGVHMYDSVVDNMTTPSIFVVFHDTQAYPEYLITFK